MIIGCCLATKSFKEDNCWLMYCALPEDLAWMIVGKNNDKRARVMG